MTQDQKCEKYEHALRSILFKCHKRKMLKNPPSQEEWWGPVMENPIELVGLLEMMGDIAYEALKEPEPEPKFKLQTLAEISKEMEAKYGKNTTL